MDKSETELLSKLRREDIKSILKAIQTHDVQLAPIAFKTLVRYIIELEKGWKE